MNYIKLALQLIEWVSASKGTSGSTWAYSNRKPQQKATVFGDSNTNATITRLKRGSTPVASTEELVTVWLNDVTAEEVELYKAEYGEVAYLSPNNELVSEEEYLKVDTHQDTSTQDSDTSQPFAE